MKFATIVLVLLTRASAFSSTRYSPLSHSTGRLTSTVLAVSSVGLGPTNNSQEDKVWVEGIDYTIPNHEEYRLSRRSKIDEQADAWFEKLLGNEVGMLNQLATDMRERLLKPVELVNEPKMAVDDEDYTPYVSTKLPWTPLVPAFGLEQFGIPIPRRNADAWRHFDVVGMIAQDYSGTVQGHGTDLDLQENQVQQYKELLRAKGGWLDDDACVARLVYINGRFTPQLSKQTSFAYNLKLVDVEESQNIQTALSRLTDGFTDELAAGVPSGDDSELMSFKALSKPNHCVGEPTSQFAVNGQQGTACFAALNTIKTGAVAYVQYPKGTDHGVDAPKPLMLIFATTKDGGAADDVAQGVSCHPRALIVAEDSCRLSVVHSMVDLEIDDIVRDIPKLYNGFTQFFVQGNANVTHSYLEETGGIVTGGTEVSDEDLADGVTPPREIEANRAALKDTHLEVIDAQVIGEEGSFRSTLMTIGGSGRVRVALSVSLLRPDASAGVKGFSLTGGAQRTDVKTNIHHMGQRTLSRQIQKNMIGGRGTGSFRGRIRVEQSAQQTDSQQISRTVLLSDRCRAWTVPSLEIIADDVTCTHGATVSDLSDEELFYLRTRGLNQATARNLLMYAFAGDITESVDRAMLGTVDSRDGLQQRIIQRLENLVPQGERKVKGEFQSS